MKNKDFLLLVPLILTFFRREKEPILFPVLPKHWHLACAPLRLRNQLPEHIRQNATVSVVFNLDWCIDTQDYGNVLCRAVRTVDNERQILSWLDVVRETNEI